MGKCLSCCEQSDQPVQNGQAAVTQHQTPVKLPQSLAVVPSPQASKPVAPIAGGDALNGEKRPFAQYPRLPPIRKPSTNSDVKRSSMGSLRDVSETKRVALFEQYKDPDDDAILAEGIERLCNDLEVRPEELKVLVLAWKFGAETMCCFTRSEFLNGCKALKVDSIKGIQSRFAEMLTEAQNKQTFKDLYRWTYKFGLDKEIGQRTLPVEMAISLWTVIFSGTNSPAILKRWLSFLEKHPTIRGIPRDTWDMFLNFAEQVGDDLSSYDDTEAWPSLFDDFVEYENDRENQNVQTDKNKHEDYDI